MLQIGSSETVRFSDSEFHKTDKPLVQESSSENCMKSKTGRKGYTIPITTSTTPNSEIVSIKFTQSILLVAYRSFPYVASSQEVLSLALVRLLRFQV